MERRKFLFRSVQASALLLVSGNIFASALPVFNPIKKKKCTSIICCSGLERIFPSLK